jgi:DNA-binding CsgD family transcriptional regulator
MDSSSIAQAVARATPNVVDLLDRHAHRCAQMCRNVPSPVPEMCRNVPSDDAVGVEKHAATCPNVPEHAGMCQGVRSDETNPPVYTPRERPLTHRQLMAARMTVWGMGSVEVARELGVNRHTVAIWKRNPAFKVELGRLHAYATATVFGGSEPRKPAPAPRRPAPAPVRMTRAQIEQEDRECEAMIADMLRAKAAGRR